MLLILTLFFFLQFIKWFIWSCGFGLDNPDFAFRSKWKGKNHLGNLLQELRSDLMRDNRE